MTQAQGYQPDFDADLKFGQEGERWLIALADEQKMEIKRERAKWAQTGNLFFEFSRKNFHTGEQEPTGLDATTSEWWAHCLHLNGQNLGVIIFRVSRLKERLKELLNAKEARTAWGGDDGRTLGVLCPLRNLDYLLK